MQSYKSYQKELMENEQHIDECILEQMYECSDSTEMEIIDEAVRIKGEYKKQPWSKVEGIEAKIKMALELAAKETKPLKSILDRVSPKDSKILLSVKPEKSILDKIQNRGKNIDALGDILRSAILVPNNDQIPQVLKSLGKIGKIVRYKSKIKGDDKEFGYYGSEHIQLELASGMTAEVQIMTKRMWVYKKAAHKIYGALRSGSDEMTAMEVEKEMKRSRDLFSIANSKASKK